MLGLGVQHLYQKQPWGRVVQPHGRRSVVRSARSAPLWRAPMLHAL